MRTLHSELPVMEQFYSVQGEGFHSGRPAFFIRLAGCEVGCSWCDVKESWTVTENQIRKISEMVAQTVDSGTNFAVITGGEPCMYDLVELTSQLQKSGIEVALETSGAYPVSGQFDWICLSPKKFRLPLAENFALADELKVIVVNRDDLEWCVEMASKTRPDCRWYLQPEWDRREKVLPLIVDYVKRNTRWSISLQTHKYINVP